MSPSALPPQGGFLSAARVLNASADISFLASVLVVCPVSRGKVAPVWVSLWEVAHQNCVLLLNR